MSQVVDLTVIPLPLAPQMGLNEAVRLLVQITNQLPNFISSGSGGATAANQTTEIASLATLHTDNNTLGTLISAVATAANQTSELSKLDTLHSDNTTLGGYITGTLKTQRPDLGTPATPSILTSTGDIISANASRKYFYVQNLSTNPLFVRLGTGASSTVFHKVLKGSGSATDGSGGDFVEDQFRGIVSISGTSPSYIAWETT